MSARLYQMPERVAEACCTGDCVQGRLCPLRHSGDIGERWPDTGEPWSDDTRELRLTRPPLNGRPPHTVRDAARNPYDWSEGSRERDYVAAVETNEPEPLTIRFLCWLGELSLPQWVCIAAIGAALAWAWRQ